MAKKLRIVPSVPVIEADQPASDFAGALKEVAAKLQSALNHRERAETSVIVATLALQGQLSDFDWRIAKSLESGAWTGLAAVYEALQQAMQLIPEEHRPAGFELDAGV